MTSLKDRIVELIRAMELTQRQFADMTDISAASLSSIINDRTKPTLNHVNAILEKLPSVNPTWLIRGVGEMFLEDAIVEGDGVNASNGSSLEGTLFSGIVDTSPTPAERKEKASHAQQEETKASEPIIKEVKVVETRVRQITEIRIFYDDQTWETFIPKK